MEIRKYPDGASYVEVGPTLETGWTTFKVNTYEDLHHLEQYVDAYVNRHQKQPNVLIPNLIDAQADRRFSKGQSSGLKLVCKRLNSMSANFTIFHPHNPEVVEALIDGVKIMNNSYFVKEVISEIYCSQNNVKRDKGLFYHQKIDNLILMSSDAGGFKPLMKLCDEIKWSGATYSASKSRNLETGKLTQIIDCPDFGGKDILIVDDISVYGGTFKGLSKLLRDKNCGRIYLAVSHITIQNMGEDPVTNYFDKVFTTDSKFDEYRFMDTYIDGTIPTTYQPENLEIIKMFN